MAKQRRDVVSIKVQQIDGDDADDKCPNEEMADGTPTNIKQRRGSGKGSKFGRIKEDLQIMCKKVKSKLLVLIDFFVFRYD